MVKNAPAFAIIGEEFVLGLRIEDVGAPPRSAGSQVDLTITVDAEEPLTYTVNLNEDLELPVTLPHGGANVLAVFGGPVEGELTDRNNAAAVQINGVRDRLRVLLVSGEPHAGERVWRNLLKSDAAVDLVHFTILRPPEKQDGVPVDELSLIAFPTRELVCREDRRVRPDHLRPLPDAGHPADVLYRERGHLCPQRRHGAGRGGAGVRGGGQSLPLTPVRNPAGGTNGAGGGRRVSARR